MLQGGGKKEPQRISMQKNKVHACSHDFLSPELCDWRMYAVSAAAYPYARMAVGTVPSQSVTMRQQWSPQVIFSSHRPRSHQE